MSHWILNLFHVFFMAYTQFFLIFVIFLRLPFTRCVSCFTSLPVRTLPGCRCWLAVWFLRVKTLWFTKTTWISSMFSPQLYQSFCLSISLYCCDVWASLTLFTSNSGQTLMLFFTLKVTGHPFWRFAENRYCVLKISPIFIKFSPNVLQCMQNMIKL